jgi:Cu2+-exporting ATPase
MEDVAHSAEDLFVRIQTILNGQGITCAKESILAKTSRYHWFLGFFGIFSGLLVILIPMLFVSLPFYAIMLIASLSVLFTLILGAKSYQAAAKQFINTRTLTMDTLFSISTISVLSVSVAAYFFPWLPAMYDVGLLIFGFRHLGLAIEKSIKTTTGLRQMFKDRLPKEVQQWMNNCYSASSLSKVEAGARLLILPGEIIPLDGYSDTESSMLLETIVTGNPLPRHIKRGEQVLAGMYLAEGAQPLEMVVTANVKQCYLTRLDERIAEANVSKAPLETAANQMLEYFIPMILLLAGVSGLLVTEFFSVALGIHCAVAVLVSACPCTLGLITPLAVKIGMNKAAEYGVLFKSAKSLQEAEKMDAIVFDLHGTLTKGEFSVRKHGFDMSCGLTEEKVFSLFALLEKNSTHLMARAVCEFVQSKNITLPKDDCVSEVNISHHSGVTGVINNSNYTVGNQKMMDDEGIETSPFQNERALVDLEPGDTVIYLAEGKRAIGYMVLTDPLRENARDVVDWLKKMGKDVYLNTGAHDATAQRYARLLGIDQKNMRTESPNEDKAKYIRELKALGRYVAMVGDAANDTLAIAASDFGIAMNSRAGDPMTQQEASAVVQSGSLFPVLTAFAVSSQSVGNIKQNLWISFSYNLFAMVLASGLFLSYGVMLNPSVGVLLMIVQTSFILLNAYRFKSEKLGHQKYFGNFNSSESNSYRMAMNKISGQKVAFDMMPSGTSECYADNLFKAAYQPSPEAPLPTVCCTI